MKPKAIVVDTNVLIHDPESIETLMNDVNILYLHNIVIQKLDKNKTKRDIGRDCREAIRRIEKLQLEKHPRLKIIQQSDWNWNHPALSHLSKHQPDHHILALAYDLTNNSDEYKEVKLITKDTTVRILAREMGIVVEDYVSSAVVVSDVGLKEVEVPSSIIIPIGDSRFTFKLNNMDDFKENEGVKCWSDWNGELAPNSVKSRWDLWFTAIKKGDVFDIIPKNISVMGLTSYSMGGDPNWAQYVAIKQLLDPQIKLCFLIGGAGTGKTILALAAALEQRRLFRNILVTRPMVHLEDEDRMGFLPGTIEDKMSPWLRPIWRSLSFIGHVSDENEKIITNVREKSKLEIEPLDYIRGMTFVKDILIIDEAQNLTPHQIKTIITRAGEHCKMIFTGDLGQIDRARKVDATSNGLSYASVKMADQPMVSVCHFKDTVRSPLAHLAERLL